MVNRNQPWIAFAGQWQQDCPNSFSDSELKKYLELGDRYQLKPYINTLSPFIVQLSFFYRTELLFNQCFLLLCCCWSRFYVKVTDSNL